MATASEAAARSPSPQAQAEERAVLDEFLAKFPTAVSVLDTSYNSV